MAVGVPLGPGGPDGLGVRGVNSDDAADGAGLDVVLIQILAVVAAPTGGIRFGNYPISRVGRERRLGLGLGLGLASFGGLRFGAHVVDDVRRW